MPTPVYQPDYQRVVAGITTQIRSGKLKPGAELPTKVDLAAQFGTSPSTIDRAMILLKAAGLVHGKQGKAVYVTDPVPPTPA